MAVYITEAHAEDVWPISSSRFAASPVCAPAARTEGMRAAAAEKFSKDYALRIPLVCADIGGSFEAVYSPWPIRFYCIRDGTLTFVGMPAKAAPDFAALREHLLAAR